MSACEFLTLVKEMIELLKHRAAEVEQRLDDLQDRHTQLAGQLTELEKAIYQHSGALEFARTLRRDIEEFEKASGGTSLSQGSDGLPRFQGPGPIGVSGATGVAGAPGVQAKPKPPAGNSPSHPSN